MNAVFIRSAEHDITNAIPRAIEAAHGSFDEICVLCWAVTQGGLPRQEVQNGVTIRRFVWPARFQSVRGLIGLALFQLWLVVHLVRLRPNVIQVLDFFCVWPAALFARLCRATCIYDIRDPFADALAFRPSIRRVLYGLDWLAMGLCHAFVLPSEERREYLGVWGRRRRPIRVVLNTCGDELPSLADGNPVGMRSERDVWIAYVGFIAATRGAGLLAGAVEHSAGRVKLVVAGEVRDPVVQSQVEGRESIILLGRVPRRDALRLMRDADVVSLLYDPEVPVNRVAAPNKLYESLCLGTPVLVARGMSIATPVAEFGLGWVIDYGSDEQLIQVLEEIRDTGKMALLRKRCRQYFVEHCSYEVELAKYRAFYAALITTRHTARDKTEECRRPCERSS